MRPILRRWKIDENLFNLFESFELDEILYMSNLFLLNENKYSMQYLFFSIHYNIEYIEF